jgi:UDP-N-acetylglucosamine 3-dehydrogenase
MIRIGFLSVAHMHAGSYCRVLAGRDDATVVGVYDHDQARAEAFARNHGVPWMADREQLLSASDAVIICAETARHRDYVLKAAAAGLPMLCEKPLATTLPDGRAMLKAAEHAGVPLYMALPVRFVPAVGQVYEAVRSGRIGRPLAMVGTNHGFLPPGWFIEKELSGGGAVMDHTPHVADLMRWILGSDVRSVYAEIDDRVRRPGIDDCGLLTLEFENGVFATLDPSWSRLSSFPTWGDVTLEVVGTEGVVAFDAFSQHLHWYTGGTPSHRYLGYGDDMDGGLMAAFLEAVGSGQPNPRLAQGLDGLKALEVALAAYASHDQHRAVRVAELA